MRIPVQNVRKMRTQTALLRYLYAGGVLTAAVVAPQLVRLFGSPDRSQPHRRRLYASIEAARNRLKQRGLISENPHSAKKLILTDAGKQTIEKILLREYVIAEPIRWDGRWRMLIFDIKESRRRIRVRLRQLLSAAGFLRLQDSAWVFPYPCEEFVALLRAHLAIGTGELRALTADALESDRELRRHFDLLTE